MSSRIDVRKTYKLYIGGAFPRSESGHSYEVADSKGKFVANAALASRKDARDAVVAARKAFGGWSGRTAYNRAQILYRIAEVMEDRRPQFVQVVGQSEGLSAGKADKVLDEAIDAFRASSRAEELLGTPLKTCLTKLKESEASRFRAWCATEHPPADHVTEWEHREYFGVF